MIICAYYTKNTPYEKVIKDYLLKSLENFDYKTHIEQIADRGSWSSNTGYKPEFVLKMLEKYDEILYLDADAEVKQQLFKLENLPKTYDIAVHYLDWMKFWRGQKNKGMHNLLSGTMLFRNRENVIRICEKWKNQVQVNPDIWEQKLLQQEIKHSDLKIFELPIEYATIIKKNGTYPDYIGKPVVIHNQVSRKYKHKK